MASFSLAFTFRQPPPEPTGSPVSQDPAPIDAAALFQDAPDMQPTWAEGAAVFHTRSRCSRLQTIALKNRRTQPTEPAGKTLCTICRQITQSGRKG